MKPNVNYGVRVIMTCHWKVVGDVDRRRGCDGVWKHMEDLCTCHTFLCEPRMVLKVVYLRKLLSLNLK